jgi:hypothetical protein
VLLTILSLNEEFAATTAAQQQLLCGDGLLISKTFYVTLAVSFR